MICISTRIFRLLHVRNLSKIIEFYEHSMHYYSLKYYLMYIHKFYGEIDKERNIVHEREVV